MIPQWAYTEEDKLNMQLDNIFGINEVSRGQLPSAGIPAIGMQFLMEQDDTRIGTVTENNELAWARIGCLILKYVGKFYEMPRVVKIAGPRLEYTVKSFVGKDLKGNYDVQVIRGSTLPGSKVLKRQEILNLRQQGLLGNPNDPQVIQKVMDMLEYGDSFQAWEDQAVDQAQIANDLEAIEAEQVPELNEFDNHALHIQKKNLYRKSDKATKLSDVAKRILEFDIERRVQLLTMSQNPQLAAQAQGIQQAQGQINMAKAAMIPMMQQQGVGISQPPTAGNPMIQAPPPPMPPPQGG